MFVQQSLPVMCFTMSGGRINPDDEHAYAFLDSLDEHPEGEGRGDFGEWVLSLRALTEPAVFEVTFGSKSYSFNFLPSEEGVARLYGVAQEYGTDAAATLDDVASNIPGALFQYVQRPDGRSSIVYMNSGCRDIWEVTPEDIGFDAAPLWEMVVPEQLPAMQESVSASASSMKSWHYEWKIRTPSGREKWLAGHGQPRALNDGSIRWTTVVVDITVQRGLAHIVSR